MTGAVEWIAGADPACLIVCEHASNRVPDGIALGVPAIAMQGHVALDIGAAAVSRGLAQRLRCRAHLATVSRLVADFNRPLDAAAMVPECSDGVVVPGNVGISHSDREARMGLHRAYHDSLAAAIAAAPPDLLISIHSFTPALATAAVSRPWPVGVLWNRDARAAIPGIEALARETGPVGANQPYSGAELNYSMDRHGEANGIPYLGIEIRQDGISDAAGVEHWSAVLERVVRHVIGALA